jgi:hypothetical protein
VHRDIKPGNVMVTDSGIVKVLDFGIAILRGAGALPRLTQVDRTVGTPAYMSPEQCLGQVVTTASDIYSLGCLLLELLTGDVPFFATAQTPLRSQHLNVPAPPARSRRADVPEDLNGLVLAMLEKDPGARPTARTVYGALLPFAGRGPEVVGSRDPTRPFRWPLLAPAASRHDRAGGQTPLTDTEAGLLQDSARALLDNDRPSEAIRLLEGGIDRADHAPALRLQLRHLLGAALFYAGEYTRAASVFDAVGHDYRRYFPPGDPDVLDCAYHAGYAYAEAGKPGKALPQLRFYVQNAAASRSGDEGRKILEALFVIAQLLATDGYPDEALGEIQAVRPLLAEVFGPDSVQVRNLDKQAARLKSVS